MATDVLPNYFKFHFVFVIIISLCAYIFQNMSKYPPNKDTLKRDISCGIHEKKFLYILL